MTRNATLIKTVSLPTDQDFKPDAVQIFKGATWFGVGTAAGIILEYATQGLLAAQLGPTDFGTFSVGLQIFTLSLTLALLSLPSAMAYFIPVSQTQGDKRTNRIIATGFWLNLTSSILVGIVLFLLAGPIANLLFDEPELASVLKLMALAVPGSTMLALVAGVLRGLKLSKQASLLTSSYDRALRFGFIVVFLLAGLGLKAPALAYLPASILVLVWGLRYLYRLPAKLRLLNPTTAVAKDLSRYSGPLLVSQLLLAAKVAVQPLLLAYFLDTRATGIYSVVLLIGHAPSMVLVAFNFLYVPVVSGISVRNEMPRMRRLYRLVATWGLIIVCPVWLLMVLLPESFLGFFGPQYSEGTWILRLIVTSSLFNVGVGAAGTTLLATGQTRTYLVINIIGAIISSGLGLLLIPVWGLVGAATGELLTVIIWNGLMLLAVYRMYRIQPFNRHYVYVLVTNIVCLLALYPVIRPVTDISAWTVLGVMPIFAGLTLLVLLRLRLLDADGQFVAAEFLAALRSQLVLVQTRLLSTLKS